MRSLPAAGAEARGQRGMLAPIQRNGMSGKKSGTSSRRAITGSMVRHDVVCHIGMIIASLPSITPNP